MPDPTQRFSTRVGNYVRYRPTYPPEVIDVLREDCGLTSDSVVADIAFGTGIFTRLLLENGNRVLGVEPNAEMRKAGEQYLSTYPNFSSVAGTAEATTLPDETADIVTAAQAAHWFKLTEARREFVRILKPKGWAVLIWNERRTGSTPFLRNYEQLLLDYGTDYKEVRHERTQATIETFFAPARYRSRTLQMRQEVDYAGLEGRLLSSSYTPPPGHPKHEPMLRELHRLFDTHKDQRPGVTRLRHSNLLRAAELTAPPCATATRDRLFYVQKNPEIRLRESALMDSQLSMSDEKSSFHMTPEEFRRHGHAVVDWIADYHARIESFPVLSRVQPGQVRAALPTQPPVHGEAFEAILADIEKIVLPGITHWQSPNFFAYFPSNSSGPAILGDLLSSGLGVQGMLWATSPACTEVETHVLDWLVPMLGLPEKFLSSSSGGGVIQDTASSASLCALLAARERATNFASNRRGCDGKLVAYTSSQAHSSIEKAVQIAGLGGENLRLIDVDGNFAMRPDALANQVEQDRQAGLVPCFVCATVGTTSSNAMDPLPEIGRICRENKLWFHVDAAMSGTAALCPEFRHFQNGVELADSYAFNPHKWMFTNFDCDCFWVANRADLINTLSVLPEYLKNQATQSGAVFDYRDWHIPLGRRFRALKLWFVIRHYGIEGLQFHVRRHVENAQQLVRWVKDDPHFELAAPAPLNLICFRHKRGDEFNQRLMDRLNRSGALFLTHTKLDGKFTLRLCVGQTNTEARHVERAWKAIQETARAIENGD